MTRELFEKCLDDSSKKVQHLTDDIEWQDIVEKYNLGIHYDTLRKSQQPTPFGGAFIKEYFAENYHITFECKTIATKLFVERMIKQENVKQIIMVKNHKSGDGSDNFAKGYGAETKIIGHLTFDETKWSKIKSKMDYFTQGRFNLFEFDGLDYDQLKLRVKINNNERTINMGNLENLSLIEAIPDEIQMPDGHPNKESLLAHFEKVANDYLSEMVLQVDRS